MGKDRDFTSGKILGPFLLFSIPIIFALFLQFLYGAIDLMIVGKFSDPTEVSAVATGSQIMTMLTTLTSSLAMGVTIFLGEKIGEKKGNEAGLITGNGIFLFLVFGIALTVVMSVGAVAFSGLMNAPAQAFQSTVYYVRVCGLGSIVIVLYNLIGSIFRGLGDSRTPLITVIIATCCNVVGDLLLVAVFHMGALGAAIATVAAQLISVLASWWMIKRKDLPFVMTRQSLRPNKEILKKILGLGTEIIACLSEMTDARIYALVRATDENGGRRRKCITFFSMVIQIPGGMIHRVDYDIHMKNDGQVFVADCWVRSFIASLQG